MSLWTALRRRLVRALMTPDTVAITNVIGGMSARGRLYAWGGIGFAYETGDAVPHLDGRSTYSVATLEGFYVHVTQGVIDAWSAHPIHDTVADVYGTVRRHAA